MVSARSYSGFMIWSMNSNYAYMTCLFLSPVLSIQIWPSLWKKISVCIWIEAWQNCRAKGSTWSFTRYSFRAKCSMHGPSRPFSPCAPSNWLACGQVQLIEGISELRIDWPSPPYWDQSAWFEWRLDKSHTSQRLDHKLSRERLGLEI